MDHISAVIKVSKRHEGVLVDAYGATGAGLGEKIRSCEQQLRWARLIRNLQYVARIRNKIAHDRSYNTLNDPQAFVDVVGQIESEFAKRFSWYKAEPLTMADLSQTLPKEKIVYIPQPTKPSSLPRLVTLGLWVMGIAIILGICTGGFTNTFTIVYKTGGFLGFFQNTVSEIHEIPSFLFWVIVIAAGVVAVRYFLHRLSASEPPNNA